MDNNIMYLGVQLVVAVLAFLFGKYVIPNVPKSVMDNLKILEKWAEKFVRWAREFMKSENGTTKMARVVTMLKEIANESGIDIDEERLRAIAQTAYEEMIAGTESVDFVFSEAETQQIEEVADAFRPQSISINIMTPENGKVAVATDNVPDGALKQNEDGTYNTYNEAGEKTGTVSQEEAEAAENRVEAVAVEE